MKIIIQNYIIFSLFFLSLFYVEIITEDSLACGDWISYKDEKCYKILDDTLRTFDEAEKSCAKLDNSPTLPTIHSKEEQDFVANYLFKTAKKVDNFWIGAKFLNNAFHWIDDTTFTYTNWVSKGTKNQTDFCVQMEAELNSIGKWIDEPCQKKNLVVCQKIQSWSIVRLQKTLLETRKQFADFYDEANKKISDQKLEIDEANKKINENKENLVPIGFIYAQLPNEKSPSEIWPWMKWSDVSTTYSGVFFRVNGGDAAAFGQVQEENAPRLTQVHTGSTPNHPLNTSFRPYNVNSQIPKTGWSDGIPMASWCCDNSVYITFEHSSGEIRPRNMAIRVWKRIS